MKARTKMNPKTNTKAKYETIQKAIKDSALQDWKDWVNAQVKAMEDANARNDSRRTFAIASKLERKPKPPPQNPTTDGNGKLLESAEEAANRWSKFLKAKFNATQRELNRASLVIPEYRAPTSVLTRAEFDRAVSRMANNKAVGPDDTPIEAVKYCPKVRDALFEIVNSMWINEKIPDGFVKAKFVMLHKKGSADNPANYRCIALLNHAFKILS